MKSVNIHYFNPKVVKLDDKLLVVDLLMNRGECYDGIDGKWRILNAKFKNMIHTFVIDDCLFNIERSYRGKFLIQKFYFEKS